MYNTDPILDTNNLQVNCLHYYSRYVLTKPEKIEYCGGAINNKYPLNDDFLSLHGQNWTFDQLHRMNVTSNDLILWSATIDLTEKYQYYLGHRENSSLSNEIFFNCTKPWFGPRCQFALPPTTASSFYRFIQKLSEKRYVGQFPYTNPNITCYTHLECDRGGANMCLDWREICNGRIDCINGGIDEKQCFEMEINECNEDEYRCHNGQCISKEFLEDSEISECLDQSDTLDRIYAAINSYCIFNYEEYMCRSGSKQFVCGDGRCVKDFEQCQNNRHLSLIESISNQENLSYTCWMTMICMTKILNQINETSCDQLLMPSDINTMLQSCDDLIQFPTVPVLFGHIRFLYYMKKVNEWNIDSVLIPDYICYDVHLCDFLIPTYYYGDYSCRYRYEFDILWDIRYKTWSSFIHIIESYFRKCSTRYNENNIRNSSVHQSSLYCCQNSTKCISKHRIVDNVSDCYLNDDEEQDELSCSINDLQRFRCAYQSKCYSFTVPQEICPASLFRKYDEIDFGEYCDRHIHTYPVLIDGKTHTDETDCKDWPCNNFYTRCDGFWSCENGQDEENCTTQQLCPSHFLPCVHPYNYTFTCLPANQVNDGKIDCVGSIDERQYCRNLIYFQKDYLPFRCGNDVKCVGQDRLCDAYQDCSNNEDEIFCSSVDPVGICIEKDTINLTKIEKAICNYIDTTRIYFSLKLSPEYPSVATKTVQSIALYPNEQNNIPKLITNEHDDSTWLWSCNQGIYVRQWLGGNNFTQKCFCPPSYYGDLCQYQSERVSLTIQMRAMNHSAAYTISITLIDDNDDRQQVISHQQYVSIPMKSCIESFNTYLTYETRRKNNLTNYSIRIDVYDKFNLTYPFSWHYVVPFLFLPVNRMAIVLYVPTEQVSSMDNCPLTCYNGICMKYMNKKKFYCQCKTGWSGVRCNISIRCNDCSSDSLCVGMIYNRSICVCPLNKGGPRCLLTLSCPENLCRNNGTCAVLDNGMNELGFVCICPKEFSGALCQSPKPKIDITIHDIKLSSILLMYLFQLAHFANDYQVEATVIAQKLTIFQRTISVMMLTYYDMVFIKTDDSYYLAVLQHSSQRNISTSINVTRRCSFISEFLTTEQQLWPDIRRVKYYHIICQTYLDTICFIDDPYICLCSLEHHANCFRFNSTPPKCRDQHYCQNNGTCLQDDVQCPTVLFCNCTDCYFGDRCQFYAKGIGLTLDDILRYELRPNITLSNQSNIVKWSCAFTMIIFFTGLINSILSLLTFCTAKSRENGCGIYLLASSVTSLLTISMFTVKFWFLLLTQINPSINSSILRGGCKSIEFLLKSCLYIDNWFNGYIALERAMTVYKGIKFNKIKSKRIAKWIIIILPILVMLSIIHEPIYRDLHDDKDEQRSWCVFRYIPSIQIYNTFIIFFHFLGPFCANLFSALFIIFAGTRRQAITQRRYTYNEHLRKKFKEHKNLIISPIVLVILTIPRLIISISAQCVKISHNSWLYLIGYLVSLMPSISIFIVFVIPSEFYKEQFSEMIKFIRGQI